MAGHVASGQTKVREEGIVIFKLRQVGILLVIAATVAAIIPADIYMWRLVGA